MFYEGCTSQNMPTGVFIRRRAEKNFTREYPTPTSAVATEWLANLEHTAGLVIQHNRNNSEYRVGVKNVPVDGFCR